MYRLCMATHPGRPNIGDVIADTRRRRGLTQQHLADTLGISVRTLGSWEAGRIPPDLIPQVEQALGVRVVRDTAGDWAAIDDLAAEETAAEDGSRIVLIIDPARRAALPGEVVDEATARAQLELLAAIRDLTASHRE